MVVDLGASASPRSIRNIEKFEIQQVLDLGAGGNPPTTDTATVSIAPLYGEGQIFAVSITIAPTNSNSTTGNATNPRLSVFLNDALIATYSLPGASGNTSGWNIAEVLQYSYAVYGGGNRLVASLSGDTTDGNGYRVNASIAAHLIPTF